MLLEKVTSINNCVRGWFQGILTFSQQVLSEAKESGKAFDEAELRRQLSQQLQIRGLCPESDQSLHGFLDASLKEIFCKLIQN